MVVLFINSSLYMSYFHFRSQLKHHFHREDLLDLSLGLVSLPYNLISHLLYHIIDLPNL